MTVCRTLSVKTEFAGKGRAGPDQSGSALATYRERRAGDQRLLHMAARVALTREEADIVVAAFKEAEAQILASPTAINERFRIAAMWKTREVGIE